MQTDLTKTEHEIIVLKAIWGLIDEMVNFEMSAKPNYTGDVTLNFNTRAHQKLFNIILVDFLSQPNRWPFGLTKPPMGALKSDMSILFHLGRIYETPQLDPAGSVLSYHGSAIAEFLNNIRWGIYEYLKPEFARSFTEDDPVSIAYRFIYPQHCDNQVARAMYRDLMNMVRSEPYLPKFEVTKYLKMRY